MFPMASTVATTAPTVTAPGRSPGSSGSSCARAASFFTSEREGLGAVATGRGVCAATRRFLLRLPTDYLPAESLGCGARVLGVADRAHHGDPVGADLVRPFSVDAADREPRLGR